MFTGIVEETGKVISFEEQSNAWRLVLEAHEVTRDLQMGDSVAVNGCCLTAVAFTEDRIEFDLLEESKRLTSIGRVGPGGKVNLERALLPSTRMGGHFVSGHVDGTGVIEAIEPRGNAEQWPPTNEGRILLSEVSQKSSMPIHFIYCKHWPHRKFQLRRDQTHNYVQDFHRRILNTQHFFYPGQQKEKCRPP